MPNIFSGKFDLSGIPPAPRGVPQIEVTFEINSDGILKVSALEKGSGSQRDQGWKKIKKNAQNRQNHLIKIFFNPESDIKIDQNGNRPSQEEIEEMIRLAEQFKKEDEELRDRTLARWI